MTHEEMLYRTREVLGRKPTEEELQKAIKMDEEDEKCIKSSEQQS